MSDTQPPETEEIIEISIEEALNRWVQSLAWLAVQGQPFLDENGEINLNFPVENDIFSIKITKKANNIIPFPQKEALPPRI